MAVHHAKLHPLVSELNKEIRIAIIVADFNAEITHELLGLNKQRFQKEWFSHIDTFHVPGAFELPAMTTQVAESSVYNLIITIGCLIKWETPHFDIIAESATTGITQVSMSYDIPVIFWLLTCNTLEQAQARLDDNYAIYWLNYVAQHLQAQHLIKENRNELMARAQSIIDEAS